MIISPIHLSCPWQTALHALQGTFPRDASCLCFVRRLFTRPAQPRVAPPPNRAKAAVRTAPSAPNQSTGPPRPHQAFEASTMILLPPCTGAYPTRDASGPSHLRLRRSASFGIAVVGNTPPKQHSHNPRSMSVITKSLLHTRQTPFSSAARSWQPGWSWHSFRRPYSPTDS
jgi:hypothetical protein